MSSRKSSRRGNRSRSGKILWLGWGDLAGKCKEAFSVFKQKGYEILALDVTEKPEGLERTEPDKLFLRGSERHHREIARIGARHGFDAVYVANYGRHHVASAIEFQHWTPFVIVAKPLDTHLDFLLTMSRDSTHFAHLLPKLLIHDHYLNKPGVVFLQSIMPRLHAKHCFLDAIKLFLVERETIERTERHRLKSLDCGMLFDLAVHMIGMLQVIVPVKAHWCYDGEGTYERLGRRIDVSACITGKYAGSLLGESTVIPGRKAETFGVIELKVTEEIFHHETETHMDRDFPVLIVVGKGVPGEQGMTRDLKTIVLNFTNEAEVALDLDTYGFRGIDDSTLDAAGYREIEFEQRGINLPLVVAAQNDLVLADNNPFQPYSPALESIRLLSEALRKAPLKPMGHGELSTTCRELVNSLLRQDGRFTPWELPDNFGNFLIGTPPDESIP